MKKQKIKQCVGYVGQATIVIVSLYLFFSVARDIYLYDVEFSDGSDDARWTVPSEGWNTGDSIELLIWGVYILVTSSHLITYFRQLSCNRDFNKWALPTFNIKGMRILSAILSILFILFVMWFDIIMPEVYTPNISYVDYKERSYYEEIDSFWSFWIYSKWIMFTLCTTTHLLMYISVKITNKK